jgi:diaminopimelate epimerase
MKFSKLQATGNDFILVDDVTERTKGAWGDLTRAICDRHFGVGADGLMLVQNSTVADLRMRLFNSDGSEAEVSGNGLRCFAKYAVERALSGKTSSQAKESSRSLFVETLSGIRQVKVHMLRSKVNRAEVNMGLPRFRPQHIPVKVEVDIIPILDYPLVIDEKKLTLALVSMGNPHAVSFLSGPVADFPLDEIGAKVETHPMFPEKTNFEIARVLSRGKIEARVWERGVGETLACGSGACAIAVAAQLLDYVDGQVGIILTGGTLAVSWNRAGEVLLSGPVQEVFTGEWLEERT